MAQPVWVLSVDLQTKTATFQSGMADAAKSARGAFTEIKSGSAEMSSAVGGHAFASRHAVMALSESFGETMPRAITALLVHIGPLGAALEAAFPFAAIALGAVLVIEHLAKLHAEGVKLTEDQVRFGTAVQTAFNSLDQKLTSAQIKSDELRNDHLGALHLQLKLIDEQSMDELVHSFAEVAKGADVVFAELKTGWYQMGIGSAGAKHALDEFQTKYESLLKQGKDKEASNLLKGTQESAEKVLSAQKQIKEANANTDKMGLAVGNQAKDQAAANQLKAAGVGYTEKELKAQQLLVDALNAQVSIEGKVAALKNVDKGNASTTTGKELAALKAEGDREAAEHSRKMAEITLQMEREQSAASMALREASIAERLAADTKLADEEYRIQLSGNQALVAALDKGGKDYNNQLKGLQDKAEEMTLQHTATVSNLTSKATEAQNRQDLQDLVQSEREKIEATDQGSSERMAAINAAIKEEQAKNLQNTQAFRELLKERVQTQRAADSEASKLAAEAGKESAENQQKMGELAISAERTQAALRDSSRRVSIQQQLAEEIHFADEEYALKMRAAQQEAAVLDKTAKDYENKLKAIQDKELQLTREHENQVTLIKTQAETDRNKRIMAAESQFNDTIVAGLTQVLMGHKSFASMMSSIGNEVVSGMMQNAIKAMEANLLGKESDAAKAARTAYNIGLSYGGPAGMILGPVFAGIAFSSVSGFQEGTDMVPGIGKGDKVPAMLEPGEGVVPGGVMDNLRKMASSGSMGGGNHYHAHMSPTYHVQALDSGGIEKVLDKHAATLARHVGNEMRKLNR
ncbi:hypothetical protein HDF16_003820 [Granulicella aggregans]|uniref:Uncharacterized protein n=1 Tax=Granulicella aggregans TaxID=474949 RepID=A0A7W7ZFU9_9BACT|nr:hypothetical protein [Granulicella aggregans]MBB5059097.1 hypothetical protein [Granulicella aggregans]